MDVPGRRPEIRPLLPSAVGDSRPEFDLALLCLAERLLDAATPQEVAEGLLESVVTTYGFPRGTVLGYVSDRLTPLASHGVLTSSVGLGGSDSVLRAHSQGMQVVASLDPEAEPWLSQLLPPGSDLVVLPMGGEQRALGALVLQLPVTLRGPQGRRLLREVERGSRYAELALYRVQRLAQLQRLAATDDLTMIANRRSFMASLDRELARSVRRNEPVSLVLLDIDHFKQVNDQYGHPAGDEALRNVAAALTIACRDVDTPARYGGEEFVVILPDCDVERSLAICERLRAAVAAAPCVMPLTASAGAATFPMHAADADQLIHAADEALLQAKELGRNRSVVSGHSTTPAPVDDDSAWVRRKE